MKDIALREYYAGLAMQHLLSQFNLHERDEMMRHAVAIADLLISTLKESPSSNVQWHPIRDVPIGVPVLVRMRENASYHIGYLSPISGKLLNNDTREPFLSLPTHFSHIPEVSTYDRNV